MKRTSKVIIEERADKYDALEALNQKRKDEKRNFTEEEVTEFEDLEKDISSLNEELRTVQAQEKADAIAAARQAGNPVNKSFSEKEEKDMSQYSLRKALLSLTSRHEKLEGIELEMQQEAEKEMRQFSKSLSGDSIAIPSHMMGRLFAKRDMTATGGTDGNQGGLTIENEVRGYIEALRERSLALQLGWDFIPGLVGNFDMPRENALYTPGFKTENAAADESNPTLTKVSFAPKRATGFVDISKQLLIQSAVGIEMRIRTQILRGHAELLDRVIFNGDSGEDEPVGILNDPDVTGVAIGTNGGAMTKATLDELIQVIEEAKAWNDNTRFVTSPIGKRHMKNVNIDSGSGKFLWERGNTLDGVEAFATTHVPKDLAKGTGTDLTALIGGDFRGGLAGQWGGTEITVDPYTQAVNGLVRFVPCQYVDSHVINPNLFKVIKDIDPA
ncbi:phage major capsid protein [Echinicola strongylocentroti]|uniref:Phage major capsid protein n=1 Tax=Echinicola strongylocentroti TaxID=1795355 RepID=A0A2Z4IND8_9BACT|nr:phage major capsid protein [Echinicola strongylocentroti]AWW32168.1 phage major capsid protein [Echinicola strongylocentroti]